MTESTEHDSKTAKSIYMAGTQEGASEQRGEGILRERGREGTKREASLLFSRFVVDEAHRVLVFDDPFDELPLGEALCK